MRAHTPLNYNVASTSNMCLYLFKYLIIQNITPPPAYIFNNTQNNKKNMKYFFNINKL